MLGKNAAKIAKKRFLYSHEYRDQKWGEKRAKQYFQKHTNNAIKICWGKKSLEKSAKTRFLYSHEYRDQKMDGKERAKQFFQKHTNSACKKCFEKIIAKKCEIGRAKNVRKKTPQKLRKNVFNIHTNIVTKKWGGETRERIFPETHE